MPNWVTNWVSIGGSPEDVKAFVAKASAARPYQKTVKVEGQRFDETVEGEWEIRTEGEGDFSFWNFVSPPEDKWSLYFTTSGWKGGERLGNTEYNWYAWNADNWGCKWDAGVEDFTDYGDGSVSYQIQTPWDTPRAIWQAIAEQHPELNIEIRFEEEQGWGGNIEIVDGELTVEREWDIPNSHADHEQNDLTCRCDWDDPADWYADCPKPKE